MRGSSGYFYSRDAIRRALEESNRAYLQALERYSNERKETTEPCKCSPLNCRVRPKPTPED
jgi:hypothetical protein